MNGKKDWLKYKDDNGKIIAFCVEIHDIAVSKLMAGREKDYEFLKNLFESEYLQTDTFLERAEMILQHPSSNALPPRLVKVIEVFEKSSQLRETVEEIKIFLGKIKNK